MHEAFKRVVRDFHYCIYKSKCACGELGLLFLHPAVYPAIVRVASVHPAEYEYESVRRAVPCHVLQNPEGGQIGAQKSIDGVHISDFMLFWCLRSNSLVQVFIMHPFVSVKCSTMPTNTLLFLPFQ